MLKGDRVDVLIEDEGKRDGKVEDVETLSTKAVWQDLDSVHDDERRECKAVKARSTTEI